MQFLLFLPVILSIGAKRRNSWTTSQRTRRAFRPLRTIFRSLTIVHALLCLGKRTALHLIMILAIRRRMMHPWRGRNAAQIPRKKTSCGARRQKTIRQPFSGEVVSPLFLSKTTTWLTNRGPPRGEVSPPTTKTNRQPLLGRVVSPSFLQSRTNRQTDQRVR
jgi:hypothetical protein